MVPDWVDAESLRWLVLGVTAVLAIAAVLVSRVVRRALVRMVLIALIGGLALGLWLQRADLEDCLSTCSCRLFGQDVEIPADKNPNCK